MLKDDTLLVPRQTLPDLRIGSSLTIEGEKYIVTGLRGLYNTETLTSIPDSYEFVLTPESVFNSPEYLTAGSAALVNLANALNVAPPLEPPNLGPEEVAQWRADKEFLEGESWPVNGSPSAPQAPSDVPRLSDAPHVNLKLSADVLQSQARAEADHLAELNRLSALSLSNHLRSTEPE